MFQMGYYNVDWTILLLLPALIISLYAQYKVKSTYKKYSKVRGSRGYTGAQVARDILDKNELYHVRVEHIAGNLTDHYDPTANVVRLSDGVYNSSSISAVGISAHECGHAIQHAVGYGPMKFRSAIIPITNIGSKAAFPILLFGMILGYPTLITLGIVLYSLMTIFQLVTLPVEFNASNRAMKVIEGDRLLEGDECKGARKVLSAAGMTYVAALLSSFMSLLRLVLITRGRRNRN